MHVSVDYVTCKWRYPPFVALILNRRVRDKTALKSTSYHEELQSILVHAF